MTYEEITAYCFALYCQPVAERETYESSADLPELVREAWDFPIAMKVTGLIKLSYLDGRKGRLTPTLTIEGEQAALFHGTREGLVDDDGNVLKKKEKCEKR